MDTTAPAPVIAQRQREFDEPLIERVKAVYDHLDCLLTGVDRLKRAGFTGFTVQAPLPRHEIEEIMYEGRPSPVRWWTLTGAMTGVTTGFLLTSLTHAAWPMINPGGKPVVAIVPFTVIMFECTILFGALATFAGMLFHCGLPSYGLDRAVQDPRVTDASFAITFTAARPEDVDRIRSLLEGTGAIEVTVGRDTFYEVPNAV
jgi:molybdopterin-containing oxidoreductase family membrane subunit